MPRRKVAEDPNGRAERFYREAVSDYRTAGQLDRDRILYSSAFARLAEVTQVVSADKGYVFHNRLTHSLKVAQLARRLAEKLLVDERHIAEAAGGLDPDVAEAAALAHDLGHPPYGHLAEMALHDLAATKYRLKDGFEGNAQSFRIVTQLAVGDGQENYGGGVRPVHGLNLSRATLNAILKYPWLHGKNPRKPSKWGAYRTESELFKWTRSKQPFGPCVKSIEAELMDWADDITFSVHDLVDFYCAGRIPLDRLVDPHDAIEKQNFFDEVFKRRPELRPRRRQLEEALLGLFGVVTIGGRYEGTHEQRCQLWHFTTFLITRYVGAISLLDDCAHRAVRIEPSKLDEIRMLKELTWHYVILHNELATDQQGQTQIVKNVFLSLRRAASTESGRKLFPPFFKEMLRKAKTRQAVTRSVIDYVASMTERELAKTYRALSGHV